MGISRTAFGTAAVFAIAATAFSISETSLEHSSLTLDHSSQTRSPAQASQQPRAFLIGDAETLEPFLLRSRLFRKAEKEILISTLIFDKDVASNSVMADLRAAARRGVKVRLLADAVLTRITPEMAAHMTGSGVEIRYFRPIRLSRLRRIGGRLHDKVITIDGEEMIIGSRNFDNSYLLHDLSEHDKVDRDIYLQDPATAVETRSHFMKVWESNQVEPRTGSGAKEEAIRQAGRLLDRHEATLDLMHQQFGRSIDEAMSRAQSVGSVRFVHDVFMSKRERPGVDEALLELIRSARSSIVLENAYLVLTRPFRKALTDAVARGVSVRIYTNSTHSNNHLNAQVAYEMDRRSLARSGIELWEFRGPATLHGKSMVIDGRTSYVGSYNLDPRSEVLNTETGVIIEDEALASDIVVALNGLRSNSVRIARNGRPAAGSLRHAPVSRSTRARRALLRLVMPLIRNQL